MPPPSISADEQISGPASSSPAFAKPVHPIRIPDITTKRSLPAFGAVGSDQLQHEIDIIQTTIPTSQAAHILPIALLPVTLRPIAFRTFTKKHNLTLTASSLSVLATFIGKNCGQGWREEGLAELVLEEIARSWKRADGRVIVDTNDIEGAAKLKTILRTLEAGMRGGRMLRASKRTMNGSWSTQDGLLEPPDQHNVFPNECNENFGFDDPISDAAAITTAIVNNDMEGNQLGRNSIRRWLKVVHASEQPRILFNPTRKQFEKSRTAASLLPLPTQKTELFRQRYHLMYQRLMRNESFQTSAIAQSRSDTSNQGYQLTQISNLLGRSGSGHLLLGLLSISPSGTLTINDLTGSIMLDLEQATLFDSVDTWLCPGMLVLVDGIYEEDYNHAGGMLGNMSGIGGTIGGRFVGFSIGAPRCETRDQTLSVAGADSSGLSIVGDGFGWVDFLGVGSVRGLGRKMQKIEQQLHTQKTTDRRSKLVILGSVMLDNQNTASSLRAVLNRYMSASPDELPFAFVLLGSFISHAALSSPSSNPTATSADTDSTGIAYKEYFDSLATLLLEFPMLLRNCTFLFVPGDNDPWPSATSAGAATALPRGPIPDMFTLRVRRAFAAANNGSTEGGDYDVAGEAIWTSNPSRLTLFGPQHEIVLFCDDISARLRRNAIKMSSRQYGNGNVQTANTILLAPDQDEMDLHEYRTIGESHKPAAGHSCSPKSHARRLVKTLLDQAHLSPFSLQTRPVIWSHAHSLSLYPLPSALILCDTDSDTFSTVYQGCCVMNVSSLVSSASNGVGKRRVRWIEYDLILKQGSIQELLI